VQVDAAIAGHFQHGLRQNAAISHHHDQYLVHRAVHHPVGEQQDHRDCHRAEYEHQFRTECMVPSGFRQPGKIPEYVFYIEYVLFLHHNVITIC
jgi:hypothetical protein